MYNHKEVSNWWQANTRSWTNKWCYLNEKDGAMEVFGNFQPIEDSVRFPPPMMLGLRKWKFFFIKMWKGVFHYISGVQLFSVAWFAFNFPQLCSLTDLPLFLSLLTWANPASKPILRETRIKEFKKIKTKWKGKWFVNFRPYLPSLPFLSLLTWAKVSSKPILWRIYLLFWEWKFAYLC